MPAVFILWIIFTILSICMIPVVLSSNKRFKKMESDGRTSGQTYDDAKFVSIASRVVMFIVAVVAALTFLLSIFVSVGTKEIGVVTSFGKPTGSLSNGLHLKAPWQNVTDFDAAVQTNNHEGARGENDTGVDPTKCTQVRIGNQSTACLDNSIRWRIKKDASDELYRDYRNFTNVEQSLVTRQLTAALNTAFADYDPLNKLDENKALPKDELNGLAKAVQKTLQEEIGKQIEVLSVIIPLARFNSSTEEKINQYQAALAETRIAAQKEKTATNEAAANNTLSASVSHDPNVLVSKCLDTLNTMVRLKQSVPPGFSCWSGNQSAIVVPAAK